MKRHIKARYDFVGGLFLEAHQLGLADEAAEALLSTDEPAFYWRQHKLATAFTLGGFTKDQRILEVGCTAGSYTLYLAREGYDVTGLDLSTDSIAAAQATARHLGLAKAHFAAGDVDDMKEVADNTFDAAFSFSTLRYLPNPVRSLEEIRRVVRPGAKVVVDFPNKYCPWFESLKFVMGGARHIHDHTYSTRQARAMMKAAGFINVQVRRIIFFAKSFPGSLVSLYKAVDWIAERTPLLNLSAGIIMCKGEKPAP